MQSYIGSKVRQAERLRAWAKGVEDSVARIHRALIPSQARLDFPRRIRFVAQHRMTERLDAHFYPGVVDEYLRLHAGKFKSLGELCTDLFNGQTQAETGDAVSAKQVTVANLSRSFLVGAARDVELPSSQDRFLRMHDLLMCNAAHNKAYIGKDLTYVHSESRLLPSTEVMTLRIDRSQVPASYVRAYLLSKLGFVQVQSTIRGITAHSYPSDVSLLDIYVPEVAEVDQQEWFACDENLARAGVACELASSLTTAAKYIVESLVDGRIDEEALIAAGSELAMGMQFADRAILSRLKVDGFDGAGQPLIPDLDQLYGLVCQAEQV